MAIGLNAFNWFGDKIMQAVTGDIQLKLHTAGAAVRARANALAPKKTGALAASIDYRVVGKTLTIFVGVPYGIYQEYGTRNIPPHPYIRPALLEMGRIWGANLEMAFQTQFAAAPMFAHQAGFTFPKRLTAKQRHHVATHLGPTSNRLYRGNVRRAKLRVRRSP